MEREQSLNQILAEYAEAQEETANRLRSLLQQRTQRALELNLFGEEVTKSLLPGVKLDQEIRESILIATGPYEKKKEGLDAMLTHVVLRNDGKLYTLEVLEQSELAHTETKKRGTLKEEVIDDDCLIEYAPLFIGFLATIILEPDKEE